MGNKLASRIIHAPGIETNQGESAKPPIERYSIGDEDTCLLTCVVFFATPSHCRTSVLYYSL